MEPTLPLGTSAGTGREIGFSDSCIGVKLKAFWKKAALAKLSCPGKWEVEKLIVRGVGIPGFPTGSAFPALAKLPAHPAAEGDER